MNVTMQKDFENDTWINVTGEIVKGNYHGDMPIIKITNIEHTEKPSEEYVYPPDDSYIPTAGILLEKKVLWKIP